MAIFHSSLHIISRGDGRSAVAAAAYRAGEHIVCNYDGLIHDYTRKGGIVHAEILLPKYAPSALQDRSTLWNAVEAVERAKNAQLAREIEVAIPLEIPPDQWVPLLRTYCQQHFVVHGMVADFCIHHKQANNPHCHIMLTMRPFQPDGSWGAKSEKIYHYDQNGARIRLPSGNYKCHKVDTTDWNSPVNAVVWREGWANLCNAYLQHNGIQERIDHRSYQAQGIEKVPSVHMGVSATHMEKRKVTTRRGNQNRAISQDNHDMKILRARITRLTAWQKQARGQPLQALSQAKLSMAEEMQLFRQYDSSATRWQKIRDLKSETAIWSFLQHHEIEHLEDFFDKIKAMNRDYYALQRVYKETQQTYQEVTARIELYDAYKAVIQYRTNYRHLPANKKAAYYQKHATKIERANLLHQKLQQHLNEKGAIPYQAWQKEQKSAKQACDLFQWKLQGFREQLSSAEKIRKRLEQSLEKSQTLSHDMPSHER